MSNSERTYGVTPPMNSDLPKDEEKRATDLLLAELRRQKTFEAPAETEKRYVMPSITMAQSDRTNVTTGK